MNLTSFFTQHFGGASFYHSHSETPDAKRFERHCHNNYELIYVVKGKGKYVVESAEYPLLPNTVLLLRPYEYHYVCPQSDSAYERYVFHFSSNLFLDAADRLEMTNQNKTGSAGIYFSDDQTTPTVLSQLQMLNETLSSRPSALTEQPSRAETLLRITINQILILLSYLRADAPEDAENEWIAKVIRYLGNHMNEDISLEEMARHFFVSKYHLCHTFRNHTGTSIFSYLTTKRIALAQQYLEEGMPANDAADRVGFHDYSVFYRAYRKITGESPSRTKKTARN